MRYKDLIDESFIIKQDIYSRNNCVKILDNINTFMGEIQDVVFEYIDLQNLYNEKASGTHDILLELNFIFKEIKNLRIQMNKLIENKIEDYNNIIYKLENFKKHFLETMKVFKEEIQNNKFKELDLYMRKTYKLIQNIDELLGFLIRSIDIVKYKN